MFLQGISPRGRLSLCHCSYCSRQLNSSLQRPCEGASGQLNLIPSPWADCSTPLYLQRIHIIHRVLSDIWICGPAVLHNTAIFYWYVHTHLQNGNLIVFNSLLRRQRTALFSKKIDFLVFLGNQFDAKEQEQGNATADFIFAALIMLNSSTQSYWLSTGGCSSSKHSRALMQI